MYKGRAELLAFVHECLQEYDGSHDLDHALRVEQIVSQSIEDRRYRARLEDTKLARLACVAALCHDTCDPKYVNKDNALHRLRDFLSGTLGMSSTEVDTVVNAIEHVSFTKLRVRGQPTTLSSFTRRVWRIVSDADMLEATGATGLVRTLLHQGYKGLPLDNALRYAETSLLKCPEYIKTHHLASKARSRRDAMFILIQKMRSDSHYRRAAHRLVRAGECRVAFHRALRRCLEMRGTSQMRQFLMQEGWVV